eukprot:5587316-Prymnesium_polylepis.1
MAGSAGSGDPSRPSPAHLQRTLRHEPRRALLSQLDERAVLRRHTTRAALNPAASARQAGPA